MFTWNTIESEPHTETDGDTIHIVIIDKYGRVQDIYFLYKLDDWEDIVNTYEIIKWTFYDLLVK